jgi:hypothetical protein
VYYYQVNGQYPFYPCVYMTPDTDQDTCATLGSFAGSGATECGGVWATGRTGCNCSAPGPTWNPPPCPQIPYGTKVWQYGLDVPGDCRGCVGATDVDYNASLPVDGDDETFYMLWVPPAAGQAPLTDVSASNPAYPAIASLVSYGIITGYGNGSFGPNDTVLRCQMAALICRAMGWGQEDHAAQGYPTFTDRNGVDDELWRNIGTLQYRGIVHGYDQYTFGTLGPVLKEQVISFSTRAWVNHGYWQQQPDTDPSFYPSVAAAHRQDVITYYRYTGSVPGTDPHANWGDQEANGTRAWFSQAEWQAFVQAGL